MLTLVLHRERVPVPVRTFGVCTSVRLYSHSECETVRYQVPYVRLQHQIPTSSESRLKNMRNKKLDNILLSQLLLLDHGGPTIWTAICVIALSCSSFNVQYFLRGTSSGCSASFAIWKVIEMNNSKKIRRCYLSQEFIRAHHRVWRLFQKS